MKKNKILFKAIAVLAAFCISFGAVNVSALADVIWEPSDNFYEKHSSECSYRDRTYKANSPYDDGLKFYESPESDKVNATVENGDYVYVSYVYTDKAGNEWGLSENQGGWAPMDYLANIYDSTEFYKQYRDQMVDERGEIDISGIEDGGTFYVFDYPGDKDNWETYANDDNPSYSRTFTDPEGHKWAYMDYYYLAEGWVCLDDITATYEELYPNGQSFSGVVEEQGKPAVIVEPINTVNPLIFVFIGVGVIVLASAVILIVIFNKTKRAKN